MNPLDEPYEASSDFADYPRSASSGYGPQPSSGSPGGNDYQRMVGEAITSSEFSDSFSGGIPVRRQGTSLRIGYDGAMAMLGFGGADGDSHFDE